MRPHMDEALPAAALAQTTLAITALSVVGATLGGAVLLAVPMAGATLYAGLQVTLLTVPPLVLLQVLADLDTTPADALRALLGGLHEGASLLLALALLTLFLGMASPGLEVSLAAYYGAIAADARQGLVDKILAEAAEDRAGVGADASLQTLADRPARAVAGIEAVLDELVRMRV